MWTCVIRHFRPATLYLFEVRYYQVVLIWPQKTLRNAYRYRQVSLYKKMTHVRERVDLSSTSTRSGWESHSERPWTCHV